MKTKHIGSGLLFLLSVLIFSGCKKDKEEAEETTPAVISYGTPTAVGTANGVSNSAAIDATGGIIISTDGRIEISIPAGALSSSTVVSIQSFTNTAPSGTGNSYDLLPDGQVFAQPVTITFHYNANDIIGSSVLTLGMAFQADDHIWYSFKNAVTDSVAQTVTATTTHFTVFSIYHRFRIDPVTASVETGGSVNVKVQYVKKATDPDPTDDLEPLDPTVDYDQPSQISWTLNGSLQGNQLDGIVSPAGGSISTTYTAPLSQGAMSANPAAITAEVSGIPGAGASKAYLISNITVTGREFLLDVTLIATNEDTWAAPCMLSYSDNASFMIADDGSGSSPADLFINNAGLITSISPTSNCTVTPSTQGDLLNVDSAYAMFQGGTVTIIVYSTRTTPALDTFCPPNTYSSDPEEISHRVFYFATIPDDGQPHSGTFDDIAGEVIHFTMTPQ